jgi:flagellar L-ring protein precursor FlgH
MKRITVLVLALCCSLAAKKKVAPPPESPLDHYAAEAVKQAQGAAAAATPGAIWTPDSQFADLGRDLKAGHVNDIVTIVVSESASAMSSGATKTQRKSSMQNSVTALAGVQSAASPLSNLTNMSGNTQLDGAGTTSRQTSITTTMTARVAAVLPNGNLLLEASKDVQVNSERQTVVVRGVIRQTDLAADNSVPSNRLAQIEIRLNGKGVVGDAIKRPFILWRILQGILPF